MQEPRPISHGMPRKAVRISVFSDLFGKNDVHRDYVGVKTVDARTENKIVAESSEGTIECAAEMIRQKPPNIIEQVRPGQFRNPMPSNSCQIDILDLLAINMDFKSLGKIRNPLHNMQFRAVVPV